jgi:hypothetical protein
MKRTKNQVPRKKTKRTPSGGTYTMKTDNRLYALLRFRGIEYGSALAEDAVYLCDEFFRQGYICVSLLYDGEDILDELDYIFEPCEKLFCFFNKEKLIEAKSSKGNIVIYYPSEYKSLACIFSTHNSEGIKRTYRVFKNRVRRLKSSDENMAQSFGYAVNNGRTEFIEGVAVT